MKTLFLVLIAVVGIGSLSSFKAPNNCKELFVGKWQYDRVPVEQRYVIRTLSKQYEYSNNGEYKYEFDIQWINNCKYRLTYKGTDSPTPAIAKIGESLTVEITEISNTKMKYKTSFRNQTDVGAMTRVE